MPATVELGYALSSEERPPTDLVRDAARAEEAAEMVAEDDVADRVVCGPDVAKHVELIRTYAEAGYTHLYVHQVGPDQQGFFRFWETELRPALAEQGLIRAA